MEKILVFIPCYNCSKQIVRTLKQFDNEVMEFVNEIIIVNNRSTDDTEQAVIDFAKSHENIPISLLRNDENYGLGGSHKVAFQYALKNGFDYVIVLHGDDQADIHDMRPVLKAGTHRQNDCCMGARFAKGSKLVGYSAFRTFGNKVYNMFFSVILKKNLKELGSSLKIYKADMLKSNFYIKFKDNLSFDYCMTMASAYYKQKYYYFPITFREEDQISNVKLFNQATNVLKMLASYAIAPQKYIESELREKIFEQYSYKIIFQNKQKGETLL